MAFAPPSTATNDEHDIGPVAPKIDASTEPSVPASEVKLIKEFAFVALIICPPTPCNPHVTAVQGTAPDTLLQATSNDCWEFFWRKTDDGDNEHKTMSPPVTGLTVTEAEQLTVSIPANVVADTCALPCWVKVMSAAKLLLSPKVDVGGAVAHNVSEHGIAIPLSKQVNVKC